MLFKRRLLTAATRLAGFLFETRWIMLSTALAIFGIVDLATPIPVWIALSLAAISVVLIGIEIRTHFATTRAVRYPRRDNEVFDDTEGALGGQERFSFFTFPTGVFLLDSVATRHIGSGAASASISQTNYIVPTEIREFGTEYRRRRVAENIDIHNGHVLGLNTDLGFGKTIAVSDFSFTSARYFDHLASDIFAMTDVTIDGISPPGFGRSLYIDRDGKPRDFGTSWLLNAVGTSLLAITTDWKLVVVHQSAKNESSKGLYAPSGSGSLEPQDFEHSQNTSVQALARAGAVREFSEETGLARSVVAETAFLGFGRWLNKSAKPEVFTLGFLSIDSHEVMRSKVRTSERPYTESIRTVRLKTGSWKKSKAAKTVEADIRSSLSLPLMAMLTSLALARSDSRHPAHELIERRLSKRA